MLTAVLIGVSLLAVCPLAVLAVALVVRTAFRDAF